MTHLNDSTFSSLAAGALIGGESARHLDACVTCRARATARGIGSAQIASTVDAARRRRGRILGAGILAAVVTLTAIAASPLRGSAFGLFTIFEPQRVVAIPLTLDDLRSLNRMPDLSAYATTRVLRAPASAQFADLRSAANAVGFPLRAPTVPAVAARPLSIMVNGPTSEVMSFAASGVARPSNGTIPVLPSDLAGSTLRIDMGAMVIATYDTPESAADRTRIQHAMVQITNSRPVATGTPLRSNASRESSVPRYKWISTQTGPSVHQTNTAGRSTSAFVWSFGGAGGSLPLVVMQMPMPRVASTGVSVARILSFMLSQPGVSPRIAQAFSSVGDLSTTLPIPVPVDKAYTQPVFVDGTVGMGVGDDTGLGAAVVWQKNGMLYAVAGVQTARNVLTIADSLR